MRQTLYWLMTMLIATLVMVVLDDCPVMAGNTSDPTERLSGTLESGWVGIGGEHTGWVLRPDGDPESTVEIDVACCDAEALQLDGSRVTASGYWTDKPYVERGRVRIFVAEQIAPAGS